MNDKWRVAQGDKLWQILAILLCGELFLSEDWNALFSPRIPEWLLLLAASAIHLMVVGNHENIAQEAGFRPFWPNGGRIKDESGDDHASMVPAPRSKFK